MINFFRRRKLRFILVTYFTYFKENFAKGFKSLFAKHN